MQDIRCAVAAAAFAAMASLCGASSAPAETASAQAASAQNCPGNPTAIGTSRVLAINPADYPRLGVMQYRQSLPLADKEVVLTFDDGPIGRYSEEILDILAAQCVKATYFLVGQMAHAYPAIARRMWAEGHTIGTHSEDHPLRFNRLSLDKARWEIDTGIARVGEAIGDPSRVAPFFRFPGLGRTDAFEHELAARGITVFSSDTVADDWHHRIKPSQIVALALSRLEKRGKGILLLHDIHPGTVAALPGLLQELKQKGFRIVHVVPAAPAIAEDGKPSALAAAAPEPAAPGDSAEAARSQAWPDPPAITVAESEPALPVPDESAFDAGRDGVALIVSDAADVPWPQSPASLPADTEPELPAPAPANFSIAIQSEASFGGNIASPANTTEATGAIAHSEDRPDRLRGHHRGRLGTHLGAHVGGAAATPTQGQRSDLFSGMRSFAAIFTPAR